MSTAGDPAGDPELDDPTRAVSHWVRLRRAQDIDLSDAGQRRFGDYELIERLGVGGMGAVYRARQLSLEREVALKLIGVDAAFGEELIGAFRSEARHAGRLQHPNIVPVYEIGSVDHLYYFSMGLVRGPTLQDWSRAQPALDSKSVARLLRSVAEAIEYAHGVGVLHLDLKPGNVLLDERGQPQVSDFGLAQRVGSEARGQAVGTPGYMAPEQAEDGCALSPATDVWGLGAILYRLLCGRAPVTADGARVLDWTVAPPRSLRPELSADLAAVCMRCLQTAPEHRYPSARALADDLQRFIDGRPVGVRRQGVIERLRGWARREPRSAALSAGLVLTLLLGLAASTRLWWMAEVSRAEAQSTLWQARRAALIDDAARGDPLLAVPALVDNIAEAEAVGRNDAAEADRLRFGLLMRQAPRILSVWPQGDEGRSLAFAERGALLLAGLRGGELRALHTEDGSERWRTTPPFPPTPWGPSYVGRIQPTPDGAQALLYASGSSGVVRPDTSAMQRVELASGRLLPVPSAFEQFDAASYSVDGDRAVLRSVDDRMQLWQVLPWRPLGPLMAARGARHCLPLAQRSEVACVRSGFTEVELLDAGSGVSLRTLGFEDGSELLSWHSDAAGRWLALGSSSGALRLLDLTRDALHRFDEIGEGAAVDLGFAGPRLSVAYADGSLRVLDLDGLRWASPRLRAGGQGVSAARLDPEGRWLLANDGRIALWALGEEQGQLQPRALQLLRHAGPVVGFQAFALEADRGLIASHGNDGEIKLARLPLQHGGLAPGPLQPGEASAAAADDGLADAALAALAVSAPQASAYRLEFAARGRRAVLTAGASLWVADNAPSTRMREVALPASAQYLLTAADAERALVGWIEPEGLLRLRWRLLDTAEARWLGESFSTEGAPAGLRLSASGAHLLLWQRDRLQRIDVAGSARPAELRLDEEAGLRIVDAEFEPDATEARVVLATQGRSVVQPATLERWLQRGDGWVRIERIDTPFAHVRVLHSPHGLLGHGPRPALYTQGQRIEFANLGPEFSEHAALAPGGRFAALGSRRGLLLLDLVERQPLLPETALPLDADDALAGLAFSADGRALELRSHYGRRLRVDMQPDSRAVPQLRLEAQDLSPVAAAAAVDHPAGTVLRRQRDPGPPGSGSGAQAAAPIAGLTATNVPAGQRFQGSRGGLGITDSAAWPQGRLRLREGDYVLAGALQLVPEGQALGAARFPSRSPVLAVAGGSRGGLELLITQQGSVAGDIECEWLDAQERVIARTRHSVPPAADPSGSAVLEAPVALLVRSAESRQRGGGSPLLRVYALAVARPVAAQGAEGVRLRAINAAPLLLGLRELETD